MTVLLNGLKRWTPGYLAGLILVAAGLVPGTVIAAPDEQNSARRFVFDEKEVLRISEAAIGKTPADYQFVDSREQTVKLSAFRGKPLIVNLVYTSCYHTCPLIVQNLARAVDVARDAVGRDSFNVVTIGFDGRNDTPKRMRAYASNHGIDLPSWRFLSADRQTVDALTKEIGFVFFPSPRGFDHLAQTSLLDRNGTVFRQIYGSNFTPPHVVEPLKDLIFGRSSSLLSVTGLVNRIKLFCTLYDPSSDRYRFDYSVIIGFVIGSLSLAAVGFVLVRAWLGFRSTGEGA
jgi:protein SCO1/2